MKEVQRKGKGQGMQGREWGKLEKEPFFCFLLRAQLVLSRLAENVELLSLYSRINGHFECFRRHFFRSGRLITVAAWMPQDPVPWNTCDVRSPPQPRPPMQRFRWGIWTKTGSFFATWTGSQKAFVDATTQIEFVCVIICLYCFYHQHQTRVVTAKFPVHSRGHF